MILISDIHGCYWTLMRLLRQCPKEDVDIVFLGDLVDRGPNSRLVVEYAMKQKIPTVLGNHEHMMLSTLDENGDYGEGAWLSNGGDKALKSWAGYVPASVRLWLRSLPVLIRREGLLISHTGHGTAEDQFTALWAREPNFPSDGLFRVFGHTPQREPLIKETYANIDTGAAYAHNGYGTLTALQWPEMRLFSQRYNEIPLTA